jgi:hypothetical protein
VEAFRERVSFSVVLFPFLPCFPDKLTFVVSVLTIGRRSISSVKDTKDASPSGSSSSAGDLFGDALGLW